MRAEFALHSSCERISQGSSASASFPCQSNFSMKVILAHGLKAQSAMVKKRQQQEHGAAVASHPQLGGRKGQTQREIPPMDGSS